MSTHHRDQPVATRLQYNNEGRITSQCKCAREVGWTEQPDYCLTDSDCFKVGTTVSIQNIFHTLPVRHKEFQRNLKKVIKIVYTLSSLTSCFLLLSFLVQRSMVVWFTCYKAIVWSLHQLLGTRAECRNDVECIGQIKYAYYVCAPCDNV